MPVRRFVQSSIRQNIVGITYLLTIILCINQITLSAQVSDKSVGDLLEQERATVSQGRVLELPANIKLLDKSEEEYLKQLDHWDSIPDEIIQRYIYTIADRAVIIENQIIIDYQKNQYHLSLLRENLAVFNKNKKENSELIANTKKEIAHVKVLDKELAKVRKKAVALTNKIMNISKMEIEEVRTQLTVAQESYRMLHELTNNEDLMLDLELFAKAKRDNLSYKETAPTPEETIPSTPDLAPTVSDIKAPTEDTSYTAATSPTTPEAPKMSTKQYAKYRPEADVMLNPPKQPCTFVRQGIDEFSGEKIAQLKSEMLFQYTNDFLKQYIKDKAHITSYVYLSRLGNLQLLNLEFIIQESNTKVGFGTLSQNALITLKLVNGATVPLYNQKSDSGTVDPTNTFTTYKGQFLLDKNAIAAISTKELDKIRVSWSTGFEDYPIYNVDVLMRQLGCITSEKK